MRGARTFTDAEQVAAGQPPRRPVSIEPPMEISGPTHPVIVGWRLSAGMRAESVYIFDFVVMPAADSSHRPEPAHVLAVYASAKTGRLGVEYVDAFEIDLAPVPRLAEQPAVVGSDIVGHDDARAVVLREQGEAHP